MHCRRVLSFMRFALGLACLCAGAAVAVAQFSPYYPPFWAPWGLGPGSMLNGQAKVISATGGLFVDQERSRILREQANQAKIETRRQSFDQMMYERANTPTFTERQEKVERMRVRRVLNNPQRAEVISGGALNILLPYLERLASVYVQGPPVPLDPDLLRSINVTAGKEGFNIGLLRNGGQLDWPIALRGPSQRMLAPLFPELVASATAGTLELALYNKVSKGVRALRDELRGKFFNDEIDSGLYLEGKRFLDSLDSAMRAVRSPSAARLLNGTYAASGGCVAELVQNMTSRGLRFAPATPGNEAPYFALHSAFVAFAAGDDSNGFRATFDPLVQSPGANSPGSPAP
jgi:hypothetical protein